MFRIALLIICGVFVAINIITTIASEKTSVRFGNFIQAVIYGLIFYYLWTT